MQCFKRCSTLADTLHLRAQSTDKDNVPRVRGVAEEEGVAEQLQLLEISVFLQPSELNLTQPSQRSPHTKCLLAI